MVQALVEEAKKIAEEGVEARLAARDTLAAAEAEADRATLLELKGSDANNAQAKITNIR